MTSCIALSENWGSAWLSRCTGAPNKEHSEYIEIYTSPSLAQLQLWHHSPHLYTVLWPHKTTHNEVHPCLTPAVWSSSPQPAARLLSLHSLLLLLMILTFELYRSTYYFFRNFILFCFAASKWVIWGRKWANIYHCLHYWDILCYGSPHE